MMLKSGGPRMTVAIVSNGPACLGEKSKTCREDFEFIVAEN